MRSDTFDLVIGRALARGVYRGAMRLALLFVSALAACDDSAGGQWELYPYTGYYLGDNAGGQPSLITREGVMQRDDAGTWRRVRMPGSNANYVVTPDGREYSSSYGIYTRDDSAADWRLLEGSRALELVAVFQDNKQNLYAQTSQESILLGISPSWYVQLAGDTMWTKMPFEPTTFFGLITTFTGTLYAQIGPAGAERPLYRVDGATLVPLPYPFARLFDFEGKRYLYSDIDGELLIQRITDAGELEPWFQLAATVKRPVFSAHYGFGKDGRMYSRVSDNQLFLPENAGYSPGDIVSIGKGETSWTFAVDGISGAKAGGSGRQGPVNQSVFSGGFVADGSMVFTGCENLDPCQGRLDFDVYRLRLGGS